MSHQDSFRPPHVPTMCTKEEGKTRQSEREMADINLTIKKYHLQDIEPLSLPVGSFRNLPFGNLVGYPTLQEALDSRESTRQFFQSLAPEVRAYFGNDPAKFLDAWDSGEQRELFEELKLLEPLPPEVDQAAVAAAARKARVEEIAEGVRSGSNKTPA